MLKTLFLAASALTMAPGLAGTAMAQTPNPAAAVHEDADPAMWIVRDDDTTIYLFGTFHLLDGRPWFNDEVKTAFDGSDELVLEALLPDNPADIAPVIMRYAVDPNGRKLSERLSPEQNRMLGEALAGFGVPAAALDSYEPWFVTLTMMTLTAQKMGISGQQGADATLAAAARERGIPLAQLENVDFQMRLLDEVPEAQQVAQLQQVLESIDEVDDMMGPMLAAWSTGNVEQLVNIMKEHEALDPAFHERIFKMRNSNWAEWIDSRLDRPGTVFVAVGAGHLAGDDSVQELLKSRGITSQRVAPQAPASAAP